MPGGKGRAEALPGSMRAGGSIGCARSMRGGWGPMCMSSWR